MMKKTIKIAHLYYDLMNLYGENGNVRFLKKKLEDYGLDVEVHFLTIDDEINYQNYDIFYIGQGDEANQELVINDMIKNKEQILDAIHSNKFFIVTGNAIEIFGRGIKKLNGDYLKCLGAFNFENKEEEFRVVGEQVFKTNLIDKVIIGFQNRCCTMNYTGNNLFEVIKGTGYNPNSNLEGIRENNFYATYLLGPILVRNPYFTDYLIKNILEHFKIKCEKLDNEDDYDYKAYNEYLKNFNISNE